MILETQGLVDEDSSNEEIDASCTPMPIPAEWDNVNLHELVAHRGYNLLSELHENVVS
jgi:hypothetical protein